jgi:hypothetical protein
VQPPDAVTPIIIEVVEEPTQGLGMIDVTLAAFGLTGVIMISALVVGLAAGALFVWFRGRRPVTTIEARGNVHDFFKAS